MRNAWFSGGVEWNVGIKGHNPLTCSPLFARKVIAADGAEMLNMYEFERIRGLVYSITARLVDDVLLIKTTIENPQDKDVFVYWWSNIAVPETSGTRIIAPARETYYCSYEEGGYILDSSPLPVVDGVDATYPKNAARSRDFFFRLPPNGDKWIAAVDGEGKGLLQFSTSNLIGRKAFVWGNGAGGRHWNDWLSHGGKPYVEMQAGLLRTQLEHAPMKAGSEISFIEGYCAADLEAKSVHGDYFAAQKAVQCVQSERKKLLRDEYFEPAKVCAPSLLGSGWGAVEEAKLGKRISKTCEFFPESVKDAEKDWFSLIRGVPLPLREVNDEIPSFVTGKFWKTAIKRTLKGTWYEYLHLGIIDYAAGDYESAEKYFGLSLKKRESAWAYRNLACLKGNVFGNTEEAAFLMKKALSLKPDHEGLAKETAYALMRAGKYADWIEIYGTLCEKLRSSGRLKMLTGACLAKSGKYDEALKYVNPSLVVPDIKEGEYSLSSIWTDIYRGIIARQENRDKSGISDAEVLGRYPLPYELDYRMH